MHRVCLSERLHTLSTAESAPCVTITDLENVMNEGSLTITFTVDRTPEDAFDAITNVRGWWSGEIDGDTDALDAEFSYRY